MHDYLKSLQTTFPNCSFIKVEQHYIPYEITSLTALSYPLNVALPFPLEVINITGEDAKTFLQGLLTADVYSLTNTNQVLRSFLTANNGKILFCVWLEFLTNTHYRLYLEPTLSPGLIKHLNFYHIIEEVNFKPAAAEYYIFCFGAADIPASADILFTDSGFNLTILKTQAMADLTEARWQFIGVSEFEHIRPIFSYPKAGVDFNSSNYPQETNLNLVSYTKGCFIGQEPIARMYNKGRPQKQILNLSHQEKLPVNSNIYLKKRICGTITTSSDFLTSSGYHSIANCKTNVIEAKDELYCLKNDLKINLTINSS